jgi:hypothetical protein
MIRRIISGGQTGVDRTAIEIAKAYGIETGGVAPKGYRTESGPDPTLATFGLEQDRSFEYWPRTKRNVLDSDGTALFYEKQSSGTRLTARYCFAESKPLILNPDGDELVAFVEEYGIETLNVAGNRRSVAPGVGAAVVTALVTLFNHDTRKADES